MTTIAAFDLATITGVCDGEIGGKPRCFSWFLADGGESHGARLHQLANFLTRYFQQEPCDNVVYEKPLDIAAMGNMHRSDAMVAFTRESIGVLLERCHASGKPVESLSVQDARQAVLGWRVNREKKSGIKTKARVMRDVAPLLGGVKLEGPDESDAAVIWLYACARANPRLSLAYTPLFGGKNAHS